MRMNPRTVRAPVALALAVLVLSSTRSAETKTLPTSAVTAIAVTPADTSIDASEQRSFTATATFNTGSPRVLSPAPIAAGRAHTCALLTDGTVDCWGDNASGQLGNGSAVDSSAPVSVSGVATATAIAAGDDHTCALLAGGSVACWGDNFRGQLGDGTNGSSQTPVPVGGIGTATAISAGGEHTCALLADGAVRCWGQNFDGQLGDGTNDASNAPVAVGGIVTATAVSAGGDHTCALLLSGAVRCWGKNFSGQLGDGTNDASASPVPVSGLTPVTAVSAGDEHTCAVHADGAVSCWGENSFGRLGNGIPGNSNTPVSVSGITSAKAVSAGRQHTCVALAGDAVSCWGSNAVGQIGNGSIAGGAFDTPVAVPGITTVTMVSAGDDHTCALSSFGTVRCWGSNDAGQLGTGTTDGPEVCEIASACSSTPVLAAGLGVAMVSSGAAHACALFTDGAVSCWGANSGGQLGNGSLIGSSTPVAVDGITTAKAISSGGSHACALLANGTVRCWGVNSNGQLGNGTTANSSVPVAASGIATATAVSAGGSHTCALLSNGTLRCWGFNGRGALGTGTSTGPDACPTQSDPNPCSTTPVSVIGISTATAVSAGGTHSCALLAGGAVSCWGQNESGQLGSSGPDFCNEIFPCSAVPLPVIGISTAATISVGSAHTCATLADGTARCWGHNGFGQLGSGTPGGFSTTPVAVSGITNAAAISAGNSHSCGLVSDGTASCWGSNGSGQLGNGSTGGTFATPAPVSGIAPATSVSAATLYSCAGLPDGTLRCWGANSVGQLGNGTTSLSNAPVPVSGIFDAIAAVAWSSLDPSVATIDAHGTAVGSGAGVTGISAAATNFDISGSTTLEVPEPAASLAASAALVALALLTERPRTMRRSR